MLSVGEGDGHGVSFAGDDTRQRIGAFADVIVVAEHVDAHGVDLIEGAGTIGTFGAVIENTIPVENVGINAIQFFFEGSGISDEGATESVLYVICCSVTHQDNCLESCTKKMKSCSK